MSLEREIAVMIIEALNIEDVSLDDLDTEVALHRECLLLESFDTTEAKAESLKPTHEFAAINFV